MWRKRIVTGVAVLVAVTAVGCAMTEVKKNPGPHTRGVRFYRPKPYLLIEPLSKQTVLDETPVQNGVVTRTVAETAGKLRMKLEWLPDFTEEYAIQPRTGVGRNATTVTLTDGWRLDKVTVKLDSQATEVVKAMAGLLGTEPKLLQGLGKPGGGSGDTSPGAAESKDEGLVVSGHEVPLGYYESVIGCGPDGKRRLYGWRYVGFAPFANCPIDMCGAACQSCDNADLYGLVAVRNKLVFRRLADLAQDMEPITLYSDQRDPPAATPMTKDELHDAVVANLTELNGKVAGALGVQANTDKAPVLAFDVTPGTTADPKTVVTFTITRKDTTTQLSNDYLQGVWQSQLEAALKAKLPGRSFKVAVVPMPPMPMPMPTPPK